MGIKPGWNFNPEAVVEVVRAPTPEDALAGFLNGGSIEAGNAITIEVVPCVVNDEYEVTLIYDNP